MDRKNEVIKEQKKRGEKRERAMRAAANADYPIDDYDDYNEDEEVISSAQVGSQGAKFGGHSSKSNVARKSSRISQIAEGLKGKGVTELFQEAREYARENPIQVLTISAVAGIGLGLILGTIPRKRLVPITAGLAFGILFSRRSHRPEERRSTMTKPVDFHQLINSVSDKFQSQYGIVVTPQARQALIIPALPHRETVERELGSGIITRQFLEDCIFRILENARRIAGIQGQSEIDDEVVKKSMDEDCPYLGWC